MDQANAYSKLGFFRFKQTDGGYLLTNDVGDFSFLDADSFRSLMDGTIDERHPAYAELACKQFLLVDLDRDTAVRRYRERKTVTMTGPVLHIFVVTGRCNQHCLYCHASAQGEEHRELDMSRETARKALDLAFKTPNRYLSIEFQGGEPLLNWPVVKYVIEEARRREAASGKELELKIVTNLTLLTEAIYRFLIDNKVGLSTSLDGPADLHDRNRPYSVGSSFALASKWIERMNKEYDANAAKGYIWKPGAITTVSRFSLGRAREIVDTYRALGYDRIYLRPLNPFGIAPDVWERIGYRPEEYIRFYGEALDHIMSLMEIRSPCGAGIGQLAYNFDGEIYTCDEGRMVAMTGDKSFLIGNVRESRYEDLIMHPVTKSLCTASCLEGLAGCSDCAYLPYCGVCPVYNYFEQGSIFGQMPTNDRCKISLATFARIFALLKDPADRAILEGWLIR
jgi:uncharacterized protein